jgi:hypothetical protein
MRQRAGNGLISSEFHRARRIRDAEDERHRSSQTVQIPRRFFKFVPRFGEANGKIVFKRFNPDGVREPETANDNSAQK